MVKALAIPYTTREIISVAPDSSWAYLMHLKPEGKFAKGMKMIFFIDGNCLDSDVHLQ